VNRLLARVAATPSWDDPVLRDELMRRYIEARVIRMTNERARRQRGAGRPGPEGSITKLFQGVHNRRLQATAVTVVGAAATAWEPDSGSGGVVHGFLRAQANTIEGGTSDIQRNVLGERILGLPKEPGPGPDTPWAQLRRNG
jgi:alkylation response protein AidB-like acyl-CoA dehydrogenase